MKISQHEQYGYMWHKWLQYRYILEGGEDFITNYLYKYSARETNTDFEFRKSITYIPAHAKSAIFDIRNAIYQNMHNISRIGGSDSYTKAVNSNVDYLKNSMNSFIGKFILPELLFMGRIGVYIDKKPQDTEESLLETREKRPYLYYYRTEDIYNWTYDTEKRLISILLQDHIPTLDEETKLWSGTEIGYRLLIQETPKIVHVYFLDEKGSVKEEQILNLTQIPFRLIELQESLLTDVASYQVALLNLGSSDMNYGVKGNFPFYVEQIDMLNNVTPSSNDQKIAVGPTQGRFYARGLNQPDFINPSSDPFIASMKKQEVLKQEIREIINFNVENLAQEKSGGFEAGLSVIGLELQQSEQQIANIWAEYEGSKSAEIKYPEDYSLNDDSLERAKILQELSPKIPSLIYQKEIAKQTVILTLHQKLSQEQINKINKEIDDAPVIVTDPEILKTDIENGLVGTETASKARLYPNGEVEKAKADHAERAARIVQAQQDASARGIKDQGVEPNAPRMEKEVSRDKTMHDDTHDRVRGKGK